MSEQLRARWMTSIRSYTAQLHGAKSVHGDTRHNSAADNTTIEPATLRIPSASGGEIGSSSERDFKAKIWESPIYTGGEPEPALAVMLSINDDTDQNRVKVDSRLGRAILTLSSAPSLLTEVRRALRLSRLTQAG